MTSYAAAPFNVKQATGYASESFIRSHHLLNSATFLTIKTGTPEGKQHEIALSELLRAVEVQLGSTWIDMVIDCEPYGIKTSIVTRHIARRHRAVSIGIAQFPLQRLFYNRAASSVSQYIRRNNLSKPMDYTERDFVVLNALGITREGTLIELQIGPEGLAWQRLHESSFSASEKQVLLNIGCGTLDALPKRPPLQALVDAMVISYHRNPFSLHLTGASFEKEINLEFANLYLQKLRALGCYPVVHE